MPTVDLSRKVVAWIGLAALMAYVLWIGGPYLRSIVIRDAAVSTWIHVSASPIDGRVSGPLRLGDRIGADGRILTVDNPRADTTAVARARADLDRARIRVASLMRVVNEIQALASARAERAAAYAANFKRNLEVKIGGLTEYVAVSRQRLALERTEADRRSALLADGTETPSAADAAKGRVADLERGIVDTQTYLDRETFLRGAADEGMFLLDDGSDGAVAQRAWEDVRLSLNRAHSELAVAQKDVEAAQGVLDEATRLFNEHRSASAIGQPGGVVWSDVIVAGSAVTPGSPVAKWIDCRIMLVDAPVSDAELSLLRPGAPADVVLEGERRGRHGTILLMRGAAATLGATDLAAVAKGRRPGLGQVLITLEPSAADVEACPVGRAAFVHFPDVTVLDIARARLRW